MVREFHTISRRVDQLLEAAGLIAAGKLTGMRWRNAEPVLDLVTDRNASQFGQDLEAFREQGA